MCHFNTPDKYQQCVCDSDRHNYHPMLKLSLLLFIQKATIISSSSTWPLRMRHYHSIVQVLNTASLGTGYITLLMFSYHTHIEWCCCFTPVLHSTGIYVRQLRQPGVRLLPQPCSIAGYSFVKHAYYIFPETPWPPSFGLSYLFISLCPCLSFKCCFIPVPSVPLPSTTQFQAVKWAGLSKPNWFKGKQK